MTTKEERDELESKATIETQAEAVEAVHDAMARAEKAEAEFRARLRRAEDLRFAAEADVERLRVAAAKAEHELHHLVFGMNQRGGGYEEALKALRAALAPPKPEGTEDDGAMTPEERERWPHVADIEGMRHKPTEVSPPERIVAAAVRYQAAGQNHSECFKKLMLSAFGNAKEQGFLTSSGRFVDRFEALKIATQAEQMIGRTKHPPFDRLMSEDIEMGGKE